MRAFFQIVAGLVKGIAIGLAIAGSLLLLMVTCTHTPH